MFRSLMLVVGRDEDPEAPSKTEALLSLSELSVRRGVAPMTDVGVKLYVAGGELSVQAVDGSVVRMAGIKGLSARCGG